MTSRSTKYVGGCSALLLSGLTASAISMRMPEAGENAGQTGASHAQDAAGGGALAAGSVPAVATPYAGAVTVPGGRFMFGPKPDEQGKRHAMLPDLDQALEVEETDAAWTSRVLADAREVLPSGAEVRELEVRCAATFCRIKIVKPRKTKQGWREIDQALTMIAPRSEAVFNTESNGDTSTGYLYFSAEDSNLPLGNLETEDGEGT